MGNNNSSHDDHMHFVLQQQRQQQQQQLAAAQAASAQQQAAAAQARQVELAEVERRRVEEAAALKARQQQETQRIVAQQAAHLQAQKQEASRLRAQQAKERAKQMEAEAQRRKPIAALQAKLDTVNKLRLRICSTGSLLLLGPKGTGKSTFRYFLGSPHKPLPTEGSDGTVSLQLDSADGEHASLPALVDTIGLTGWDQEQLLKLIVLLLFHGGLPADTIMFSNRRIEVPLRQLALLGITNPMLVNMHSSVWAELEPHDSSEEPRIRLHQDAHSQVRHIVPSERLHLAYDLRSYKALVDQGLNVRPITHHDDVVGIISSRRAAGITPFGALLTLLARNARDGCFFTCADEQDKTRLDIAKLAYLFAHKYSKDAHRFANEATLAQF
jgi:hypothetical protein